MALRGILGYTISLASPALRPPNLSASVRGRWQAPAIASPFPLPMRQRPSARLLLPLLGLCVTAGVSAARASSPEAAPAAKRSKTPGKWRPDVPAITAESLGIGQLRLHPGPAPGSVRDPFEVPQFERLTPAKAYLRGPFGRSLLRGAFGGTASLNLFPGDAWATAAPRLGSGDEWSLKFVAPQPPMVDGAELGTDGSPGLWPSRSPAASKLCLMPPVSFVRYGGESDSFSLLTCDGQVAPGALDRLSVLARPTKVPRPSLPLPEVPEASGGEWVKDVRLLHPRVLWLMNALAKAFRYKTIYLVSGYRKKGHRGFHNKGRAMDVMVLGVPKEHVYWYCRSLWNVGCGYYPNSKFVHMDARGYDTGHVYWIDTASPGGVSNYVATWPGVEKGRRGPGQHPVTPLPE